MVSKKMTPNNAFWVMETSKPDFHLKTRPPRPNQDHSKGLKFDNKLELLIVLPISSCGGLQLLGWLFGIPVHLLELFLEPTHTFLVMFDVTILILGAGLHDFAL
jgi:hypothetical protein